MKSKLMILAALAAATVAANAQINITELQYKGLFGEFFEITNTSGSTVNLTGYVFDDNSANPAVGLSLTPLGSLASGQSAIVTEVSSAIFTLAWFTEPGQVASTFPQSVFPAILGGNTINLGRTDAVYIFPPSSSTPIDKIQYTDADSGDTPPIPESVGIRAEDVSTEPTGAAVGQNSYEDWVASTTGNGAWKSGQSGKAGTLGSPGKF